MGVGELFWLCRNTALHYASLGSHMETVLALGKAGADVDGKDNDGYGFSGCIVVSGVLQCGADGPSTRGRSGGSGCFGCAG
jgi:hypothetical protein